jgi:iron complex outermembrane receptor protein
MSRSVARSDSLKPAPRRGRLSAYAAIVLLALITPGRAQSVGDLRGLSIEQLGDVEVTSVSRSAEALSDAPAAVYVISHDDIIRSGATTIPELLRLAPNLEVARIGGTSYAISARGFNVGSNASLSNKLLVLIDGRSVYSPMFGGVYWDMQVVPPDVIDHIEVISGPGAALWGANAVNGVINIITRSSAATMGGLLTLGGGNLERHAAVQYGGRLTPELTYRLHLELSDFSALPLSNGTSAGDRWWRPSGGVRLDWNRGGDQVSVQGDIMTATQQPGGFIRGSDAAANWRHVFADGSSLQLLTWFSNSSRAINNGSSFSINTYDLELQHNFTLGSWNNIVWGAGERALRYTFENTALALVPPSQTLNLANIFVQDTISLSNRLKLTLGLKLEHEPYAGWQLMPSARLAWKATDGVLLWAAVSRALRSPTPVDANLREFAGTLDVLNGSTAFRPEALTAYEIGTRVQATPTASFSISAYYDVYDKLRSINASPTPTGLPFQFGNLMSGKVYGVEMWGNIQVARWWRLAAGFNILHEDLTFLPGSTRVGGLAFVANDPTQQATLHSSINFTPDVSWDLYLREVGMLAHPRVAGYTELDMRLAWDVTPSLRLSLSGFNLLHPRHTEFLEGGISAEVPRSVFVQARIRF